MICEHLQRQQLVYRSGGFTLLELLVVMVIIGLLAAYVGPKYFSQIGKAEIKMAQSQIDALEKALHQLRLDVGSYPSTEQGLTALVASPDNNKKWQGPYLSKKLPPDPWGRPYIYKYPGEHSDFDLFSHGKDGQPGGEDEMADITNW
jgi:general secretion pathway protein G